jgi:hypothetical protein
LLEKWPHDGQQLTLRKTPISGQLAVRLGYRNISKGVRRLDRICHGELMGKDQILAKLPSALNLPEDVVAAAIQETRKQVEREIQAEFERQEAPVAGAVPPPRHH